MDECLLESIHVISDRFRHADLSVSELISVLFRHKCQVIYVPSCTPPALRREFLIINRLRLVSSDLVNNRDVSGFRLGTISSVDLEPLHFISESAIMNSVTY